MQLAAGSEHVLAAVVAVLVADAAGIPLAPALAEPAEAPKLAQQAERTSTVAAAVRAMVRAVLAAMRFSTRGRDAEAAAAGRRASGGKDCKATGPAPAPTGPEAPCELCLCDVGYEASDCVPAGAPMSGPSESVAAAATCAAPEPTPAQKKAAVAAVVEAVLAAVRCRRGSRCPRAAGRASGPRPMGPSPAGREQSRLRAIGDAMLAAGGLFCCAAGRRRRVRLARRRPDSCEDPAALAGPADSEPAAAVQC